MSNYYLYLLLGPKVYSKYYTDTPEIPDAAVLSNIMKSLLELVSSCTRTKIMSIFGLTEDVYSLIVEDRGYSELLEIIENGKIRLFSLREISNALQTRHSIEDICALMPLNVVIEALEGYTKNPLVRSSLGNTAESIYQLLLGYKIFIIGKLSSQKQALLYQKFKLTDIKAASLRKDYMNLVYFLANIITKCSFI